MITILIFAALGTLLGHMGYGLDSWEFWAVILLAALPSLIHMLREET